MHVVKFAYRRFGTSGSQAPLAESDLFLPDEELGWLFLEIQLRDAAWRSGYTLETVPPGFVLEAKRQMNFKETAFITSAGMEKVYRLVARNAFAEAGKLLRDFVVDRGVRLNEHDLAVESRQRSATLKVNASKGAAARQKFTDEERAQWKQLAANPEWQSHSKRRRAQLIAEKIGLDKAAVETIRKAI